MPHSGGFKKGNVPWNKGKKNPGHGEWLKDYSYQKGHKAYGTKPVGSTRMTVDGYIEIKIEEGRKKWRLLHYENWKKKHGSYPPKGTRIRFIDGDRSNCELDNLELATGAEILELNSFHNYPPELKQCIKMTKKLERMIDEKQH